MHTIMMTRRTERLAAAVLLAASTLLTACGGDGSTAPKQGPPSLSVVNGVPLPTGLVGMTILIQGTNLGDAAHGKVLFTPAAGGTPVQATIANTSTDWTGSYVVTTVPQGVDANTNITVQTAVGTSNAIPFSLVSNAAFSPSTITWARANDLPAALQGLGAAFVPGKTGGVRPNTVFTIGGANATNVATTTVYAAPVQGNGSLGTWTTPAALPQPRAYLTAAAATAYTAAIDTATAAAYLYAIGGVDATAQAAATVYVAKVGTDGTLGTWAATTPLPAAIHSAGATVFRGYVYVAGGADNTNAPVANAYRAVVHADGTLGAWEPLAALPQAAAYLTLAQFGPYLYAVGGDAGTTVAVLNTATGTETANVYRAAINLRDGTLTSAGWSATTAMGKARSKHSTLVAGGALLTSSGVYGGAAGSSENQYAGINADGTVGSWQGATGVNTIASVVGYSLYNEAAVSFVDATGHGHVLLLGGADRATAGKASAAVVYY